MDQKQTNWTYRLKCSEKDNNSYFKQHNIRLVIWVDSFQTKDQKWGLSRYKEFLIQVFLFLSLFSSVPVQFSCSVTFDSLRSHRLQHARLPCPSLSPGICSNSCPLSWWCHPSISSSVAPFSSCPQCFPASGSFPVSWLFTSGAKVLELQLQHQSFRWISRVDFL